MRWKGCSAGRRRSGRFERSRARRRPKQAWSRSRSVSKPLLCPQPLHATQEGGVPSRTRTDAPGSGGQRSIQLSYRDTTAALGALSEDLESPTLTRPLSKRMASGRLVSKAAERHDDGFDAVDHAAAALDTSRRPRAGETSANRDTHKTERRRAPVTSEPMNEAARTLKFARHPAEEGCAGSDSLPPTRLVTPLKCDVDHANYLARANNAA